MRIAAGVDVMKAVASYTNTGVDDNGMYNLTNRIYEPAQQSVMICDVSYFLTRWYNETQCRNLNDYPVSEEWM